MKPLSQTSDQDYNQNYNQNYSYQQTNGNQNSQEPIDPSVKHSYIFNKYFKDYKDMNVQPVGPRRPQSIQELKQMLREDKIKEIQHKIRVAQIKPKHMLFTNARGLRPSINNLRSMNFG